MSKINKTKTESNQTNTVIRVEGTYAFRRGDTFSNFEQVANRLQAHTEESLVYYWIRDSRLARCSHTKTSRKIDSKLQYYTIRFSCIFGGQRFKSKSSGVRPGRRQTRQIDCPGFISLRATKCGQKLEVIDVCNDHTHEISEQAVEELPQKRRPSHALLEEVQELLHLNVDKKMIIEYVKQKENKNILKKDLFNIAIGLRRNRERREQDMILQRIKETATQEVIQEVVYRQINQIDPSYPSELVSTEYEETTESPQNAGDVFDASTPSVIDFSTLSPEMDLLNPTDCVEDHIEYDELLGNRIINDYDEENNHLEAKSEADARLSQDQFRDFICGDGAGYVYDELELGEEIPKDGESPLSSQSHDLDDKEYFNDLILTSPEGAIYPIDVPPSPAPSPGDCKTKEDECPFKETKISDECPKSLEQEKRVKSKKMPKYYAEKTRRTIIRCRNCGTNARLMKMQISYLRQQRKKLLLETEILRLEKRKLKAELNAVRQSSLL